MPNPQEPEMNDLYLLDLNRLSKHRLEMLLTNKHTPDQILLVAVNNMPTIGRGLIIGSNAEKETNTVEEIFTIANWIASNPKAKNSICESIVNQLVASIDEFDEILDNQIPIHEKLYLYFVAHRNEEARSYIASQSDLPDRFLQQLAFDSEWLVRSRIAQRKNLPADLVNLLAGDIDNDVRSAIMNNYELTEDLVRRLVNPSNHGEAGTTDLHGMVEFIIAQWPALPADVVARLSKHKCSDVRLAIAKRQNLASDILGNLSVDRDEDVWLCAARRLVCSRNERNQNTEKASLETQIVSSTDLPGSQLARKLEQGRPGASRNSHSGVSAVHPFLPFMRRQFALAKLAIASIIRFITS